MKVGNLTNKKNIKSDEQYLVGLLNLCSLYEGVKNWALCHVTI